MKKKELIENFVEALIKEDKKFLWENRTFRDSLIDPDEKAYFKKIMLERLPEMRKIVDERFEKNNREHKELLKRLGMENVFPDINY